MPIAFFDLDRTLISRNSGMLWVRSEWRLGHISTADSLVAYAWLMKYALGAADLADAIRQAIATFAGDLEEDFRRRTTEFYAREVRHLYRPGALSAIARHRASSDALVLLTSSSTYLAELAQQELDLHDVLCNRLEVNSKGRFTGAVVEPLCFGAGKVVIGERYASERDHHLDDCVFYTDSASDLPMLEAVGRPVAVNPDRRLRRVASERGWEIVDWGTPP